MMIQEIKYEDKKEFDEVNDIVEEEDPKEIDELLREICKFLDALRRGEKWLDRSNAASLKKKIENLEDMLADAKSELDKLLDKKD